MEIKLGKAAIAGERFDLYVKGQSKGSITRTTVYIEGKLIHAHDCDDPPCHETFVVPINARGKSMLISAESSNGQKTEMEVDVTDTDRGTGMLNAD